MTFSRAINSTGKINQNIRSAGLAGSGWQETSQVGLTNSYQSALNQNTSDYNNAVKEMNLAISQAQQSGDIATMQAIQTYAIQLAQQLYQEARAAVADAQWEKSYQLQVAAFELQKAAQEKSSDSITFTSSPRKSNTEDETEQNPKKVIRSSDSHATSDIVKWKIEELRRRTGLVSGDFIKDAAILLSDYVNVLNDKDLDALARSCGINPDQFH